MDKTESIKRYGVKYELIYSLHITLSSAVKDITIKWFVSIKMIKELK